MKFTYICLLFLLFGGVPTVTTTASPNIIIFVPDEMRAESMGTYGHPVTRTPNYDKLASDGTKFTLAMSTYPVCTQSRASFLTGRWTHNAGHRTLWNPLRYYEPNLFRYAKNAGYEVIWYGKNDALDPESFNTSVNIVNDLGKHSNNGINPYNVSNPLFYSFINDAPTYPWMNASDATNTLGAINYLTSSNRNTSKPFLIYLPLTAPHPPYGCPEPFYSMYKWNDTLIPPLRPTNLPNKPDFYDRIRYYRNITRWDNEDYRLRQLHALYLGCISYSDAVFGLLIDALQSQNLYNDTAIFVLSDHGDYGGDYGLVEKWPSDLNDVLVHVPLIAKLPEGQGKKGQVANGLVQHMDILPTILDIMNVSLQHVQYGVSQLSVLQGTTEPDMERVVFAEGGYSTYEPRDFEGDCSDPLKSSDCSITSIYYPKAYQEWNEKLTVCRSAMVRSHDYKLIRRSDPLDFDHDSELYDLFNDPQELNNVYQNISYSSIRSQLTELLFTWYLQTADVTPWDEVPRGTPAGNYNATLPRIDNQPKNTPISYFSTTPIPIRWKKSKI